MILDQAGYALFFSFLIQWMKNTKWFPVISADTAKLNRVLAVVASGITAFGIHHTFDASAGTLTITGLTLAGIYHGGWQWLRSYMVQEITYQKLVKEPAPAATPVMAASKPSA